MRTRYVAQAKVVVVEKASQGPRGVEVGRALLQPRPKHFHLPWCLDFEEILSSGLVP
jgi:hypothetical protein